MLKRLLYAVPLVSCLFIIYKIWNFHKINSMEEEIFSNEIVYNGNHYKLINPILKKKEKYYFSLEDLSNIPSLQNGNKGNNILNKEKLEILPNEILERNNKKYLTHSHLEKAFGIDVDFFYNKKTNTLSLQDSIERNKEEVDKELGSTIFLEKKSVEKSKFEPRNGIYLGGYVLQDEFIDSDMDKFNKMTDKKHATFFKYVGYGKPFPTEWVNEVKRNGGFATIALEPNGGLDEVKDNEYLRNFAKEAAKSNIPIILRYASEMNGTWTFYSGNEKLYIEKWKLVHKVMEEEAPNVAMLWNVFTMPENTINGFYPGDDYVDYVGVNIYNVLYHNDNIDSPSDFEDPLRLLDYVYNQYSHKKPIIIGEFGASNYNTTDGLHYNEFAINKISRLYKHLPYLYPRVKVIYYFNVNNLVNAPEGRKINNYAITEEKSILSTYKTFISKNEYLTNIESERDKKETFSFRDFLFFFKGELYVDKTFFENYLNMTVLELKNKKVEIEINNKKIYTKKEILVIDKAAFYEKRKLIGLPIEEILQQANIKYEFKEDNLYIFSK